MRKNILKQLTATACAVLITITSIVPAFADTNFFVEKNGQEDGFFEEDVVVSDDTELSDKNANQFDIVTTDEHGNEVISHITSEVDMVSETDDAMSDTVVDFTDETSINGTVTRENRRADGTYTITYDLSGGTNAAGNPETGTTGSAVTLKKPSKEGAANAAWMDENGDIIQSIPADNTEDIVLTATYLMPDETKKEYAHTPNVDDNGDRQYGIGKEAMNYTETVHIPGAKKIKIDIYTDAAITSILRYFAANNYSTTNVSSSFSSSFTAMDMVTTKDEIVSTYNNGTSSETWNSDQVTFQYLSASIPEDCMYGYYAIVTPYFWTPAPTAHEILYTGIEGADNSMNPTEIIPLANDINFLLPPKKSGFRFVTWVIHSITGETYEAYNPPYDVFPEGTVFEAVFTEEPNTFWNIDLDGGMIYPYDGNDVLPINSTNHLTSSHYTNQPLVNGNPTKFGYQFAGWLDTNTNTNLGTTAPAITYDGQTHNWKALWTPKESTILVMPENTSSTVAKKIQYGQTYAEALSDILPETLPGEIMTLTRADDETRTANIDDKWEYANDWIYADKETPARTKASAVFDFSLSYFQNRYLKLSTDVKTLTMHFDANGGIGTMADENHTYKESVTLPANTFTKEGAQFVKWTTNPDGTGDEYYNKEIISWKNLPSPQMTLYAQWDEENKDDAVRNFGIEIFRRGGSRCSDSNINSYGLQEAVDEVLDIMLYNIRIDEASVANDQIYEMLLPAELTPVGEHGISEDWIELEVLNNSEITGQGRIVERDGNYWFQVKMQNTELQENIYIDYHYQAKFNPQVIENALEIAVVFFNTTTYKFKFPDPLPPMITMQSTAQWIDPSHAMYDDTPTLFSATNSNGYTTGNAVDELFKITIRNPYKQALNGSFTVNFHGRAIMALGPHSGMDSTTYPWSQYNSASMVSTSNQNFGLYGKVCWIKQGNTVCVPCPTSLETAKRHVQATDQWNFCVKNEITSQQTMDIKWKYQFSDIVSRTTTLADSCVITLDGIEDEEVTFYFMCDELMDNQNASITLGVSASGTLNNTEVGTGNSINKTKYLPSIDKRNSKTAEFTTNTYPTLVNYQYKFNSVGSDYLHFQNLPELLGNDVNEVCYYPSLDGKDGQYSWDISNVRNAYDKLTFTVNNKTFTLQDLQSMPLNAFAGANYNAKMSQDIKTLGLDKDDLNNSEPWLWYTKGNATFGDLNLVIIMTQEDLQNTEAVFNATFPDKDSQNSSYIRENRPIADLTSGNPASWGLWILGCEGQDITISYNKHLRRLRPIVRDDDFIKVTNNQGDATHLLSDTPVPLDFTSTLYADMTDGADVLWEEHYYNKNAEATEQQKTVGWINALLSHGRQTQNPNRNLYFLYKYHSFDKQQSTVPSFASWVLENGPGVGNLNGYWTSGKSLQYKPLNPDSTTPVNRKTYKTTLENRGNTSNSQTVTMDYQRGNLTANTAVPFTLKSPANGGAYVASVLGLPITQWDPNLAAWWTASRAKTDSFTSHYTELQTQTYFYDTQLACPVIIFNSNKKRANYNKMEKSVSYQKTSTDTNKMHFSIDVMPRAEGETLNQMAIYDQLELTITDLQNNHIPIIPGMLAHYTTLKNITIYDENGNVFATIPDQNIEGDAAAKVEDMYTRVDTYAKTGTTYTDRTNYGISDTITTNNDTNYTSQSHAILFRNHGNAVKANTSWNLVVTEISDYQFHKMRVEYDVIIDYEGLIADLNAMPETGSTNSFRRPNGDKAPVGGAAYLLNRDTIDTSSLSFAFTNRVGAPREGSYAFFQNQMMTEGQSSVTSTEFHFSINPSINRTDDTNGVGYTDGKYKKMSHYTINHYIGASDVPSINITDNIIEIQENVTGPVYTREQLLATMPYLEVQELTIYETDNLLGTQKCIYENGAAVDGTYRFVELNAADITNIKGNMKEPDAYQYLDYETLLYGFHITKTDGTDIDHTKYFTVEYKLRLKDEFRAQEWFHNTPIRITNRASLTEPLVGNAGTNSTSNTLSRSKRLESANAVTPAPNSMAGATAITSPVQYLVSPEMKKTFITTTGVEDTYSIDIQTNSAGQPTSQYYGIDTINIIVYVNEQGITNFTTAKSLYNLYKDHTTYEITSDVPDGFGIGSLIDNEGREPSVHADDKNPDIYKAELPVFDVSGETTIETEYNIRYKIHTDWAAIIDEARRQGLIDEDDELTFKIVNEYEDDYGHSKTNAMTKDPAELVGVITKTKTINTDNSVTWKVTLETTGTIKNITLEDTLMAGNSINATPTENDTAAKNASVITDFKVLDKANNILYQSNDLSTSQTIPNAPNFENMILNVENPDWDISIGKLSSGVLSFEYTTTINEDSFLENNGTFDNGYNLYNNAVAMLAGHPVQGGISAAIFPDDNATISKTAADNTGLKATEKHFVVTANSGKHKTKEFTITDTISGTDVYAEMTSMIISIDETVIYNGQTDNLEQHGAVLTTDENTFTLVFDEMPANKTVTVDYIAEFETDVNQNFTNTVVLARNGASQNKTQTVTGNITIPKALQKRGVKTTVGGKKQSPEGYPYIAYTIDMDVSKDYNQEMLRSYGTIEVIDHLPSVLQYVDGSAIVRDAKNNDITDECVITQNGQDITVTVPTALDNITALHVTVTTAATSSTSGLTNKAEIQLDNKTLVEADSPKVTDIITGKEDGTIRSNTRTMAILLQKEVAGNMGNKDTQWKFKITLTRNGTPETGIFNYTGTKEGTINFDATGVGYVTLQHGDTIRITDIKAGTDYTIEEVEVPADYQITKTNDTGTTALDDINVVFVNTKTSTVPTGIHVNNIWMLGLMIALAGCVLAIRKRQI